MADRLTGAWLVLTTLLAMVVLAMHADGEPQRHFPDGFYARGMPGGAVAVVKDGKIVWAQHPGVADTASNTPIDRRTNFRLASLTKQITAVATLVLVDREQVALDEPLRAFWPDLPSWADDVTVEYLLTHTSGLPEYYDLDKAQATSGGDGGEVDGEEDTPLPRDGAYQLRDADVLTLIRGVDALDFEPGSRYRYNNAGYALLALIVEQRSGQSFSEFLRENVFEPLGMRRTVARVDDDHPVSDRAFGHRVAPHEPDDGPSASGSSQLVATRTDQSRYSAVLGDGGVYSSLDDLARWHHGLNAGKVLSRELLARAQSPFTLNDGNESSYGYGWRVSPRLGRPCVWHNGSSVGFRTAIRHFPGSGAGDADVTVIVLINRTGADQPAAGDIADDVARLGLQRARR